MLQTLLLVLFVSFVITTLGLNVILIYRRSRPITIDGELLVLAFFSGLSVAALLSSWLSLFSPLSFWILTPIVSAALINIFFKRKALEWKIHLNFKSYKSEFIVFIVVCLLFIQQGSLIPFMPDTKTYHLQIVRWYQEYKTVPGVANLYPRYGFYSNWFHLVSILSFSANQENLLYLNTTLSIWFTLFLFLKISNHRASHVTHHRFFTLLYTSLLLFMFIGWNLLRGNCRSTNNDFIVTVLILYILLNISESLLLKKPLPAEMNIIFILSASVPFYKLTGAFVLIIICIYLIQTKQVHKQLYSITVAFSLFAIPYLIKNFIQTGYIFFPFTFFDIFTPDWKLPAEMANRFNEYISLSNKYIYTNVPSEAWEKPSYNWLNSWYFKLAFYDKVLLLLNVATVFFFLFKGFKNTSFKHLNPYLLVQIPVCFLWFISGPDPRFLYGYILFSTFTILSIIVLKYLKPKSFCILTSLAFVTILLLSTYKGFTYQGFLVRALPAEKTSFKEVTINNTSFIIPDRNKNTGMLHCEILAIPCIYQFNPYLQMRGESIESGFRMNTPVDSGFINKYRF